MMFFKNGIDTLRPVVTYSESESTSSFMVDLALRLAGCEDSKLYLNWEEYAKVPEVDMSMGGLNISLTDHFETILKLQPENVQK